MEKLLKWKAEQGSVYQIKLEGHAIIYRTLTAFEIQALMELKEKNSKNLEQAVCSLAVISHDPLPVFELPGTLFSLSSAIWEKSAPQDQQLEEKVEELRAWATTAIETNFSIALATLIARVMPSIDFTALLNMPLGQLLKIAALVEKVTNIPVMTGEESANGTSFTGAEKDQSSIVLTDAINNLVKK